MESCYRNIRYDQDKISASQWENIINQGVSPSPYLKIQIFSQGASAESWDEERMLFAGVKYWIGKSRIKNRVVFKDDPSVSLSHALIFYHERFGWVI
mmetsp:Transcript_34741/g.33890  ORF Transcript_34741/g.33890 Transcript_34741/m.33890 type:complete len:97 (-) Transcript_34741:143-433(-)